MKKLALFVLVLTALALLSGCNERVPPGYVGMVMTPAGLGGDALQPGLHSCYNRDVMYLVETTEVKKVEKMEILCKDKLNFIFDLKLRTRLRSTDANALRALFEKQGSKMKATVGGGMILAVDTVYDTYVEPVARNATRNIVAKYETLAISDAREEIQAKINTSIKEGLKGTPMELIAAYPSNFDFPKVVTNAVEKAKKREMEIEEEKAKQKIKLLQAKNRRAVAEEEKLTRTKEAQAEAAYIAIIGKALNTTYLKRLEIQVKQKEVEAKLALYERAGAGDKIIVTQDSKGILPMVGK